MAIPYYKKLLVLKRLLNPIVIFLDKTRLIGVFVPFANLLLKGMGLEKRFNAKLDYRIFADIFANTFSKTDKQKPVVTFLFMAGAKSRHNLRNMLIGKFLELKGYQPVFLVCDGMFGICNRDRINRNRQKIPLYCYECFDGYRHMAQKTGLPTRYLSEFLNEEVDTLLERERVNISQFKTLKACGGYSFQGNPFGKMTRKSVLYYLTQGEFENRPEEVEIYKKYLNAIVKFYLLFRGYLNSEQHMSSLVLNNGELAFDSVAAFMVSSADIPYITQESFEAPNSWIYKKNGIAIRLRWEEELADFLKTDLNKTQHQKVQDLMDKRRSGGNMVYKFNNPDHAGNIDFTNGKFVGLFTNFMWDTTILERNSIFESMREWILETIEYWREHEKEISLIIRAHPAEVKLKTAPSARYVRDIINTIELPENVIFFDSTDEVNSYEIINSIEYGIVYASSIGLEIPFYNKPCLVAGDPHYRNQEFTLSPQSKTEYLRLLKKLNKNPAQFVYSRESLYQYLYFIYFHKVKYFDGFRSGGLSATTIFETDNANDLLDRNETVLQEFYETCVKY